MESQPLAARYHRIAERVAEAAKRVGRSPESVRLVAVTKYAPASVIADLYQLGVHEFGESKLQDALPKLEALASRSPTWHFIGHLQTNKVKRVIGAFSLIHAVDSWKLAEALSREAVNLNRVQPILVQVNISGETSKYGMASESVVANLERIVQELPGVQVQGLMMMAPQTDDPEAARPHFRNLRMLRDACVQRLPAAVQLQHLSMGMTQDFTVAIEEGATLIRVGSALFR